MYKDRHTLKYRSTPNHCQRSVSVSVSVSAQDGIVEQGKAHTRSAPSLSILPKVALETVPIFAWLNTDRSRPWRVECRIRGNSPTSQTTSLILSSWRSWSSEQTSQMLARQHCTSQSAQSHTESKRVSKQKKESGR